MLNHYDWNLPQEFSDRIEATRWAFTRLLDHASETMTRIQELQHVFKKELKETSSQVRQRIRDFIDEYAEVRFIVRVKFRCFVLPCTPLRYR